MRFLLCLKCRTAWIAPVAASCCGEKPLDCNPWSADGVLWYRSRVRDRLHEIGLTLLDSQQAKRCSLVRGIRAKGNESFRVRAAC